MSGVSSISLTSANELYLLSVRFMKNPLNLNFRKKFVEKTGKYDNIYAKFSGNSISCLF